MPTVDHEQAYDEIELLGFPLCAPFDLIRTDDTVYVAAQDMKYHHGKWVQMLGYYVTRKPVRRVKGDMMYFYTWVDKNGHFFDTIHFPDMARNMTYQGHGCYSLNGKITDDFGFKSLEVKSMEKIPYLPDERY